jgi:asparagine synthase (glutamine-hydrolysing)
LGGLGGDELFYGYPSWNQVAESLKISRKHKSLFPWKGKKLDFIVFILKNWKYVLYAGYPNKIDEQTIVPWTYEDYCRFVENAYLCYNHQIYLLNDVDVSARFDTTKPEIEAVYQHNFENFMGGMCLYLADRLGMGNAIEIRSPLIDYKLIEFVSSLSIEMKYDSKMAKSLLKETLEGIIPSNILYGKKQGFTPPISYINEIVAKSSYKYITSDFKFFNSILTDRVICNIYR